jgi:hypothetical protein
MMYLTKCTSIPGGGGKITARETVRAVRRDATATV